MLQQLPKELAHARELMDQAKLDEALEIIEQFEKKESVKPSDMLSALLLKGRVYFYKQRTRKTQQTFELAYQMSQDLGLVYESIVALIGKAKITRIDDPDKALIYVKDAEKKLNSLAADPYTGMLRRDLLLVKSWILLYKGNLNGAAELAKGHLKLTKEQKIVSKLALATSYNLLGWVTAYQGNHPKALDYAMKSLKLHKELNHATAIGNDYSLIVTIYRLEGNYDQALHYCKESSSIKETLPISKLKVLEALSDIYRLKGKLNRALKYRQQAVALAEEINRTDELIINLIALGYLYRMIGKNELTIEYAERSLILSEKYAFNLYEAHTLNLLVITYIEENSREIANRYFSRLSELHNQTMEKGDIDLSSWYLGSKAYVMKTSTRMRDRADAQTLYKELINRASGDFLIFCLSNLCDLLFEELSIYNDPEILDEIVPLITKSLEMAETNHNYRWLAETKLLQAKLALIQMNIEEAKKLMVEAQCIADLRGLNLLAYRISGEHDKLLDQIDVWNTVKKDEAPMAERVKLASTNEVLERIQGKRAVEPLELVEEEPILLLIMDNSGVPYFNHSFVSDWDIEGIFSSFISVFNTFSSELFSKSIDRIRIGENTILINPVEPFLACYVIKGQSYPALQKLTRFTEAIRENSEIWQALNKSVKTSEMLELDKPSALKTVINEIFTG